MCFHSNGSKYLRRFLFRTQQRRGSQNSDQSQHVSGTGSLDHLQRMAQLNASITGSPAKSTMSHASQVRNHSVQSIIIT